MFNKFALYDKLMSLLIIGCSVGIPCLAFLSCIPFYLVARSFDRSEMVDLVTTSRTRPLVIAFYGHTSFLDTIFGIWQNSRLPTPTRMLMKFPYPTLLPKWIHRQIVMIDPDKSNTGSILSYGDDVVLSMWIEGARNRMQCVHSGFVHIATSLNADLALCYIDWDAWRYRVKVLPVSTYSRETVLEEFTEFIGDDRCAVYPGSCSEMRFKCAVDDAVVSVDNTSTYGSFV